MDHSHEEDTAPESTSPKSKLWLGFFILMYPIIITFSLLFTGILWVFSGLSWIISTVAKLLSRSKTSSGASRPGMVDEEQ
ncbi:MAG: hypothetical protein V4714_01185 [Bacteroidota bacterium]